MDSYGRWPIHIDGLPKRTIFHSKLSQITGVYWVYLKIWNPQIHPQVRHDSLADIFLSKISFSIFSPLANGWVKDLLSPSSCLGREVLRQTTKQASEAPQARRARYPPWSGRGDMEVSWNGGTPIAGWFITGNPIKMDDLGVPPFQETSIWKSKINVPNHQPVISLYGGFPFIDGLSLFLPSSNYWGTNIP